MLTPCKQVKGETEIIIQREKAARDLFSTAVSRIRQPFESFLSLFAIKFINHFDVA